jgi:hypothetical protein
VFYLPLAFLGVPPLVFIVSKSLNLLYQFWVHTELVGRLGPLEWVFNTPSHHRVHHGMNRQYLDKNYAGILIVWDRLFGTFEPERERAIYGTVTPFRSWNPLWAQLEYLTKLWDLVLRAPRFRDKLLVWVMPPDWMPAGLPPLRFPGNDLLAARPKYDADHRPAHLYVGLHYVAVALVTMGILLVENTAQKLVLAGVAAWALLSLVAFAGLFERRVWGLPLEWARLALSGLVVGAALWTRPEWRLAAAIPLVLAMASMLWASRVARSAERALELPR